MTTWINRLRRLPDSGATAVEYALMIGLIAVAIVGAVRAFHTAVNNLYLGVLPGF